jgi:hypothetical protein
MSIKIVMNCRDRLYDLIKVYEASPEKVDPKDFLLLLKLMYEYLTEEQIKSITSK